MELQELVIEIIHHLKKGPFAEVVPARLDDFYAGPIPIMPNEDWFRNELMKFNSQTERYLDDLKSLAELCDDHVLMEEQQMKLSDAKSRLKRNKLLSDTSIQMGGILKGGEMEEYDQKIEHLQLFIDVVETRLKSLESTIPKDEKQEEFDVEKEGLTKNLKIGSLAVSKTGADIAFLMHVLRRAGWLKYYKNEHFDNLFAEILEQNAKALKDKEYHFLKNFMSTLSHVKGIKYDKINLGKKESFQITLKSVIEEAQKSFLDDNDTYDFSKT